MNEPKKEYLKLGDILDWIPGVTEYQVEKMVTAGLLAVRRMPGSERGCRFFLKSQVREVFLTNTKTNQANN